MGARSATSTTRRRKKKGGGRPSELTDDSRQTIVKALRTTLCPLEDAGWLVGISPRTIMRWRTLGERDDENGRKTPERDFWRETSKAIAEGRVLIAGRTVARSHFDGTLGLKILERRDPKNWGLKQELDVKLPAAPAASPRDRILSRLDAIEEKIRHAAAAGIGATGPVPPAPAPGSPSPGTSKT